ncbi:hypothetical protein N0V93_001290 [Gnomoniopsis smithogilvyi]|uniref:Uncharacterized protein n=1 Tax=Gnomoniopsis smithogilvyi TaxID=1191159 RepID=A0A9W8Z389_9PEZI|nr:hypothetical protein N0V93_001290 [Gnomoniopsis smithogilvyi]
MGQNTSRPALVPQDEIEKVKILKKHIARIQQALGDDKNQTLQEAEPRMARFIYRGFHNTSGGGDPRLNNEQGVTPHAFLPGKSPMPWTMQEIPTKRFSHLVVNHLSNSQEMATPFSSWSPDLGTALYFATGQYFRHRKIDSQKCYLAVLDTWEMFSEEERPFRVVPMGMIGEPTCGCEYLVYGPVQGPAYSVVRIEDIQQAVGCPLWPYCPTREPIPHRITAEELQEARNMSQLFKGSKAMKWTVFLAENCRQQWSSPRPGRPDYNLREFRGKFSVDWSYGWDNTLKMMLFTSGCEELIDSDDMLPLFNRKTNPAEMARLRLALILTVHTEWFLKGRFKALRDIFTAEEDGTKKPFLYPKEHVHDCRAPGRVLGDACLGT